MFPQNNGEENSGGINVAKTRKESSERVYSFISLKKRTPTNAKILF